MPMDAASFTTMQTQNQLMDITDLLDEYGTDIKEILGTNSKGHLLMAVFTVFREIVHTLQAPGSHAY